MDKTLPVYLFCQSGNRSKSASSLLVKMGFSQVFDLRGGFSNWS
ncbi:MAG: rhodanese-like domain-containing protein [Flavobacteriaceae bacterium]